MFVEPVEDGRFKRVTADIEPVIASALGAGIGASQHILGDHRIAATAAAAFDQAGEQMLRPPAVVQGEVVARLRSGLQRQLALPLLHRVPQVLVDDAEFRHVLNGPFAFRIEAGDTFARVGVFQIAEAVANELADIKFVVEDAGPALRIAPPWRNRAVIWVKRERGRVVDVQHERPDTERYSYRPELLFNYGVKLGGQSALGEPVAADTLELFKGQNIFPQGLLGEPLGRWSLTARRETTRYIYTYSNYLSYENTFALREIAQLPTAAPIADGQGFQNTAYVVELTEAFPLNSYLLSRVVQFYAARVLRSSIIEDLGCHWYKRTIPLLPIPPNRTAERMTELREAGRAALDADSDLANRYREIDGLISLNTTKARTINDLIIAGSALVLDINLNGVSEDPVPILHIEEDDESIHSRRATKISSSSTCGIRKKSGALVNKE